MITQTSTLNILNIIITARRRRGFGLGFRLGFRLGFNRGWTGIKRHAWKRRLVSTSPIDVAFSIVAGEIEVDVHITPGAAIRPLAGRIRRSVSLGGASHGDDRAVVGDVHRPTYMTKKFLGILEVGG
jgi:hypothetical protein